MGYCTDYLCIKFIGLFLAVFIPGNYVPFGTSN